MKKYFLGMMLLLGTAFLAASCSSDEEFSTDTPLEELVLDEYNGEKWDGVGLPSWLPVRFLQADSDTKLMWIASSVWEFDLLKIYKFIYQDQLLLAVNYRHYGFNNPCVTGTDCFTATGSIVEFHPEMCDLEKDAELILDNRWDGENVPKLASFGLENDGSLDWLQEAINEACAEIQEPEQLLFIMQCGYVDNNTHILLHYVYADYNADAKASRHEKFIVYSLDGQLLDDYVVEPGLTTGVPGICLFTLI